MVRGAANDGRSLIGRKQGHDAAPARMNDSCPTHLNVRQFQTINQIMCEYVCECNYLGEG